MAWAQRKGKRFERLVARVLGAKRGLQTIGRGRVPDVDLPGWWVECKRQRAPIIGAAYRQAVADARFTHREPAAVTQADHGPALVTVSLESFAWLCEQVTAAGVDIRQSAFGLRRGREKGKQPCGE